MQKSADEHDLKLERFSPDQIQQRLPILKVQPNHVGLFEPEAGFLRVEHCVAAHLAQARKRGAELQSDTRVISWLATDEGVTVETDGETYRGRRLAICAGAWSQRLLTEVDVELNVIAKQQNWYQIDRVEQKLVNDFPIVFIEEDDGQQFYCVPELDSLGLKVCRHTGGHAVENADSLNCDVDKNELLLNEAFMDKSLHHSRHRLVHHSTCMYTMSCDGHFIIDNHPDHANVAFAAGLSGHGFKFTPVLGHRLIEILDGNPDSNLDFLSLKRFG